MSAETPPTGGSGDDTYTKPLKTRKTTRIGKSFSSRNPTPIGAIGLVLIIGLLFAAFNAEKLPLIGGGTEYKALFTESANLKSGDDVRIAGVKVGTVQDVTVSDDTVAVDFTVKDGFVGDRSTFAIKLRTLLGAKYLAIDSVGSNSQDAGQTITKKRTTSPFDVYPAFTAVTDTIDKINTAQLTQALNVLSQDFSGTPDSVKPVVTGLSRLSTTIASRDTELRTLLSRANQVTGTLADRDTDLQQLLSDGNLLLDELNQRRDAIHSLLINTQILSTQLSGLVNDNQKTLGPLLDNLDTLLTLLKNNQDSLDRGLALLGPFYRVFNNTIGNGRWFDNYIQNLSGAGVVGLLTGSLGGVLMAKLSSKLTRAVILVVVVAIVVVGAVYLFSGSDQKKVTAKFAAAVGIYPGTPVKILGVNVGDVTSVKPHGGYVEVGMEYDSQYTLPSNVGAVEVANSLVSDRYIQLTPAYKGGNAPKLGDTAAIPLKRTSAPAELDDIYSALNKLSVALGPKGANKTGALSTLVKVGSANLKGNGAALGNSISKLSQAAKTLSDGRKDLFGTVSNLQKFTKALSDSDSQVRKFNDQLAQVAGDLADERTDLGAALHDLGLALDKVSSFVKKNAGKFHTDIKGLEDITGVLVKQKASLNETLAIAPVALANIVHAYQPNIGVIATRSNLSSLTNPTQLCAILYSVPDLFGGVLKNGSGLLGKLTKTIGDSCTALLSGNAKALGETIGKYLGALLPGVDLTAIGKTLGGLLGSLGGVIGGTK